MENNSSSVFPSIIICICLVLLFASSFMGQTIGSNNSANLSLVALERESNESLNRPRLVSKPQAYLVTAGGAVRKSDAVEIKTEIKRENKNESYKNPTPVIRSLERQAFDILNRKRIENNLTPLEWSESLSEIARMHSENMARLKFFSHRGRDGLMVDARADLLGISRWQGIGENIAFNQGYEKPVEFACERWMQSVKHRENILHLRWKETGIGIGVGADGAYYFTQVFMER